MLSRRYWVIGGAIFVVALVVATFLLLAPRGGSSAPDAADRVLFAEQASLPPLADEPVGPGFGDRVDQRWLTDSAAATGIPRQALAAYVGAVIGAKENFPDCTIGWNTLAGIGLVESDHARHGGAVLDATGHAAPEIFGVPLTGGNVENIPDTDIGAIDGTSEFDRAVGPMQIIPQTWTSWLIDGNGDGIGDPHNIYDATLAAADYLCFVNPEWGTSDDWRSGVSWYNSEPSYAGSVAQAAQRYFELSR